MILPGPGMHHDPSSGGGRGRDDHEDQAPEGLTPLDVFGPHERHNPPGWPYRDLDLSTPHCPLCGWAGALMLGTNVHPQAFCTNDDCGVWTWDPTQTAAAVLLSAGVLVEYAGPDGATLWAPHDVEPPEGYARVRPEGGGARE